MPQPTHLALLMPTLRAQHQDHLVGDVSRAIMELWPIAMAMVHKWLTGDTQQQASTQVALPMR